jgi:hypothetical protein
VRPSTTTLRASGGSSVTLYFGGLELQNWTSVSLRLTKTSDDCVGTSTTLSGTYLGNSSVFFRGDNLLNDTLCGVGSVDAEYALDGVHYEGALSMSIMTPVSKYRALFVYTGASSELGWSYAVNLGRLAISSTFGVSVDAPYVESIAVRKCAVEETMRDKRRQEGSLEALCDAIAANLPLDLVMLASAVSYAGVRCGR